MPQNPSPAGTQSSTAPSPTPRSPWLGVAKTLLLCIALIYIGASLWDSIVDLRYGRLTLEIRPAWLIASAAIVIATYALLIQTWRHIVSALDDKRIPFLAASKIWFVSNLGAYIPGRVWQIIQMGAMSRDVGIGPMAAGTAAIINAAVHVAVGLAIGVIASTGLLSDVFGRHAWLAWGGAIAALIGIFLLPALLPLVFRLARRWLKADVPPTAPPARLIGVVVVANIIAWIGYGAAFQCLALGVLGEAPGNLMAYTGSFATSYTAGYLSQLPGGLGAREVVLQQVVSVATGMSLTQAQAIALTSRLWLLIIQVLPALLFLAYRRRRPDETAR